MLVLPPVLFIGYVFAVRYFVSTEVLTLTPESPANAYVAVPKEFWRKPNYDFKPIGPDADNAQLHELWRVNEELMRLAPDKSAEIKLEQAPYTSILEGCYNIWIYQNGQRKRVLKLYESDPGSGTSFSWAWAKDSKAVLITGSSAGFDCQGSRQEDFRLIYTVTDGKLWRVK